MKYDCTIGPNEEAGGGSNDPKVTFKCEDIGDGKKMLLLQAALSLAPELERGRWLRPASFSLVTQSRFNVME
jgi:hypothetical protein